MGAETRRGGTREAGSWSKVKANWETGSLGRKSAPGELMFPAMLRMLGIEGAEFQLDAALRERRADPAVWHGRVEDVGGRGQVDLVEAVRLLLHQPGVAVAVDVGLRGGMFADQIEASEPRIVHD